MNLKVALLLGAIGLVPMPALASPTAPTPGAISDEIYDGLLASGLIDSHIFSRDGKYLGRVRNVAIRDSGQIEALIVERERISIADDAVFRVSWDRIVKPVHPGILIAGVVDFSGPEFGLFPETKPAGENFLVSEVLGEYARLQAGQGYGYVKDAVFDTNGNLLAVLIARDVQAGGGTFAFAYPGRTGKWSPDMSYYGLPYVTADQASKNGFRVDRKKFKADDLRKQSNIKLQQ